MCCLYLCVIISTVKSATYYYRAGREGREIIVPLVDRTQQEVQPLIVELKKDPLVVVDEIVAVPTENKPAAVLLEEKIPEPIVRLESKEPESIRENDIPKSDEIVVADEARRIPPAPIEKLESLEIIPAAGSPPATISETVKEATIEAIRATNAEIVKEAEVAPVAAADAIAQIEPKPVETLIVADVVPEIKSTPNEVAPIANIIVPVPESVVVSDVKSTPIESVPVAEIVIPVEKVAEEVAEVAKEASREEDIDSIVRQSVNPSPSPSPNPIQTLIIDPFQNGLNAIQTQFQNAIMPIQNAINSLRPNQVNQADTAVANSPVVAAVETVTSVAPTSPSGPAAFLQQFSNTLSNILRPSATAATVPDAAAAPAAPVEIIQSQSSNEVNDKVDLAKSAEKIE